MANRNIKILAVGLMVAASAMMSCTGCSGGEEEKKTEAVVPVDTLPVLIMQVKKCSKLYTAEYDIHKIITHSDEPRLKGNVFGHEIDMKMPVGDRKIAIPIDVKLKAYIDFGGFSEANVQKSNGKITIILPDPKVTLTSSKVDQENIKEFVSFTRSNFTDAEMSEFERQGRQSVISTVPELGIIETARENAARILIPMIMKMGYAEEDITVTFRKDFSRDDVMGMIEKMNN